MAQPVEIDFAPLLLLLLAGQLAATERMRLSVPLVALSGLTLVVLHAAGRQEHYLFWAACLLVAWDVGFVMQSQMKMVDQERQAAEARAEQAAAHERQRIAREVHDVIAHSLSVTLLHLTAARHCLQDGASSSDLTEAVEALQDAERLGRQAMNDIRRTVGLLESGGRGTQPMPGIPEIARLVEDFRTAGLRVGYEVRGDPHVVPASAGLGLYRIAQESLSNVAKHAPGAPVRATLDLASHPRRFTVWNSLPVASGRPPGDGAGSGLRGMSQRAELIGGVCRAGPDGDGWSVTVEFPASEAERTAGCPLQAGRPAGHPLQGRTANGLAG